MYASHYLQGIRGNAGDYGNVGETGPKVSSDFILHFCFTQSHKVLTKPYIHILRVKQEAEVKKGWEDPGANW